MKFITHVPGCSSGTVQSWTPLVRKYYNLRILRGYVIAKFTLEKHAMFDSVLMPLLPGLLDHFIPLKKTKIFAPLLLTNSSKSMPIFYSILVYRWLERQRSTNVKLTGFLQSESP